MLYQLSYYRNLFAFGDTKVSTFPEIPKKQRTFLSKLLFSGYIAENCVFLQDQIDRDQMSHHSITPIDRELPEFSRMQQVKRQFFAMRNGMLAHQMRSRGLEYRVNFGLNIPQIKEIAAELLDSGMSSSEQLELANRLWENANTRESRLLAPMLFPADIMPPQTAAQWLAEAQTTEVADHLCHSLLRHLPFAADIAIALFNHEKATSQQRYSALRLLLNLVITGKLDPVSLKPIAENAITDPLTRPVARQLLEEIEFLTE